MKVTNRFAENAKHNTFFALLTSACMLPLVMSSDAAHASGKKPLPSIEVHLEVLDSLARSEFGTAAPVVQALPRATAPAHSPESLPNQYEAELGATAKAAPAAGTASKDEGVFPWLNNLFSSKKEAPAEVSAPAPLVASAPAPAPAQTALVTPPVSAPTQSTASLPWLNPSLSAANEAETAAVDVSTPPEKRVFKPLKVDRPGAATYQPAPMSPQEKPADMAAANKPLAKHTPAATARDTKPVELTKLETPKAETPKVEKPKEQAKVKPTPEPVDRLVTSQLKQPLPPEANEAPVAAAPVAPQTPALPELSSLPSSVSPALPELPAPAEAATTATPALPELPAAPAEVSAPAEMPAVPAAVATTPADPAMPQPTKEELLPVIAAAPDAPAAAAPVQEDDSWFPGLKKQFSGVFGGDDEPAPAAAVAPPATTEQAPALAELPVAEAPALPSVPDVATASPTPVEAPALPEVKEQPVAAQPAPALPELPEVKEQPVAAQPAPALPELPELPALASEPATSAPLVAPALPELPALPNESAAPAPVPAADLPPLASIAGEETPSTKVDSVAAVELPPVTAQPEQVASAQQAVTTSATGPDVQIVFKETETEVPLSMKSKLTELATKVKSDPNARITIVAYAAGTDDQASTAKRVSLSRALAVRASLIEEGLDNLRINVEVGGNKSRGGPADRVDIFIKQAKNG